jgi:hypothetical protein
MTTAGDACPISWGAGAVQLGDFAYTAFFLLASALTFAALLILAACQVTRKHVDPCNWLCFTGALALAVADAAVLIVAFWRVVLALFACL